MKNKDQQEWIILVHLLPQKPTSLRVRTWRKLQALGALPIKNSVYVLPYNEKTSEDFQWLKQEIESLGGEASLFRADSIEGATDKEIIRLFRKQRDEEYAKLIAEFEGLSGATSAQLKGNHLTAGKLSQYESELSKLRHELDRVTVTDFFGADLAKKARAAYEKCRRGLQARERTPTKVSTASTAPPRLKISDYQNRRWVTRKNPHIDRVASGWLIRRFIDKRPRFYFVSEGERIENGVTFDLAGGDLTHEGEDCTFETIIKSFGLGWDDALAAIAEIVHDIDLKDNKFNRPEASGVNAVIRGISEVYADDGEKMKRSFPVFDALYEVSSKEKALTRGEKEGRLTKTKQKVIAPGKMA